MTARAKDFLFDLDNMRKIGSSEERILELVESYFKMEEKSAYNDALLDMKNYAEKLRNP